MAQIATGNRDDALEIVQDAMMDLVRKYRRRNESEWRALFYRILQNRIRDWHRRQAVRNRWRGWLVGARAESDPDAPDPLERHADPAARDPAETAGRHAAVHELDRALRDLPRRQQQAFLLRAWEGLDVAETARAMGCSEGSVKTHYSRAVHALRERLGPHWE